MPDDVHRDSLIALAANTMQVARKLETWTFADPQIVTLSPVERLVIGYIDRHPGTTLGELAETVNLQTSNASAAVRRLTDLGLVERHPDTRDRRRILLSSTFAAAENLARVHAEWARAMAGSGLDPADLATAVEVLATLDAWLVQERAVQARRPTPPAAAAD